MFVVHIPASEAVYADIPRIRFEDVAPKVGLDGSPGDPLYNAYIHTASWGDVDNDGWVDLFAGTFVDSNAPVPNKLLLNKNGVFVDAGQSSVEIDGRGAGSVFADFDNDGDLDLYVSNNTQPGSSSPQPEPSHIYRNDNGTFVDVTSGSGISAQSAGGRQVGVLDYNNDGLLDIFVVADNLRSNGPTVLLKNNGSFRFTDATAQSGLPTDIHGLGLAIGDMTGNGWPDIFVAGWGSPKTNQRNWMFIANGDGTYRTLGENVFDWSSFVNGNEDWVSGAAFADLNRDGRLDLVVAHHFGSSAEQGKGAAIRVYMNRSTTGGDPVFEDITSQSGLPKIVSKSPHVEIQDFDNDGWPDIYASVRVGSGSTMQPLIFMNEGLSGGDPRFSSPDLSGLHQNDDYYAGGPVADFNRDGKLDIFLPEWRSVLSSEAVPSKLMQNTGAPGNWLQIKVDVPGNRMGVGAKVKIYKEGTSQLLGFREISPAFGFSSSQPAIAHFGLGNETLVDVVVEMPFQGAVYTATLPANRLVVMPNGEIETPAHLGLEATPITENCKDRRQFRVAARQEY